MLPTLGLHLIPCTMQCNAHILFILYRIAVPVDLAPCLVSLPICYLGLHLIHCTYFVHIKYRICLYLQTQHLELLCHCRYVTWACALYLVYILFISYKICNFTCRPSTLHCVTGDMLPGPAPGAPALSDHLRPQVRAHRPTDNVRKMLQIIFENHPHDLWIWKALQMEAQLKINLKVPGFNKVDTSRPQRDQEFSIPEFPGRDFAKSQDFSGQDQPEILQQSKVSKQVV